MVASIKPMVNSIFFLQSCGRIKLCIARNMLKTAKDTSQTSTSALKSLNGGLGSNLVQRSSGILGSNVSVHFHQLCEVEFGLLKNFHLSDENTLQREDSLAFLLDFNPNRLVGDAEERKHE